MISSRDPTLNTCAQQSYCMMVSAAAWRRSHWHRPVSATPLGLDLSYHGDIQGFGSYAAKNFVCTTFNSCFLDPGSKHLEVESGELHDIPAAQSAHVFSVGPGNWMLSEQKGLTEPSDSGASWQLWHVHCPKCPERRHTSTVRSRPSYQDYCVVTVGVCDMFRLI